MYHHVNFVKRLRLLYLENQSDYRWFVLLHNCLNYNKLPSLFLESSCVYGLRSTDSNIYSVPKIMRTCSAGGFPYAALFLQANPPSQLEKYFWTRAAFVEGCQVPFISAAQQCQRSAALPCFHKRLQFLAALGSVEGLAELWALSDPWGLLKAYGKSSNCTPGHSSFKYLFDGGYLLTQG